MRAIRILLFINFIALTGCSLLDVQVETGVVPLPEKQRSMRIFTRDFVRTFNSKVEETADLIKAQTPDKIIQANTLLWKLGAEQALQNATFQPSPVAGMLDTWVLTAQMHSYFASQEGSKLFGPHQSLVVKISEQLHQQFEQTVRGVMSTKELDRNQLFLAHHLKKYPITSLAFARPSAYMDWLEFTDTNEFEIVTTYGSVPEVLHDMSERMAMLAEQTPKFMTWKTELYALKANLSPEQLQQTLASIEHSSDNFRKMMANSPQMVGDMSAQLADNMLPLVQQLSESTDQKLLNLEAMIAQERLELEAVLDRQRQAAGKEIEVIGAEIVKTLIGQISGLIIYFVIFLITVFFAPLALGIWLGRKLESRRLSLEKQPAR